MRSLNINPDLEVCSSQEAANVPKSTYVGTHALFFLQNGPLSTSKTRLAIHECECVVGLRQVRYNINTSLVNITTTTTGKRKPTDIHPSIHVSRRHRKTLCLAPLHMFQLNSSRTFPEA